MNYKVFIKYLFMNYKELKKVNATQATDTSDLVKTTDYNAEIDKVKIKIVDNDHAKYITTQKRIRLKIDNFAARLKQANLATKGDIADFVKKKYLMIN